MINLKKNLEHFSFRIFLWHFEKNWVEKIDIDKKLKKAIFWKNTAPEKKSQENRPPKTTQKTDLIDRPKAFW